jgi:uncharacterized protein
MPCADQGDSRGGGVSRDQAQRRLTLLPGLHAVCRLAHDAPWPAADAASVFFSVTRTPDELSIVCEEASRPPDVRSESGFRILKVEGPIDFDAPGIMASLTTPLAAARISVLAMSTFDTDYLLVRQRDLERALDELRRVGWEM